MAKYLPQIIVGAIAFAGGMLLVDQLKKQGVIS